MEYKLDKDGFIKLSKFKDRFTSFTYTTQEKYGKFYTEDDLNTYIEDFKTSDKYVESVFTDEVISRFRKQFLIAKNDENGVEISNNIEYDFDRPVSNVYMAKTNNGLTLKAREIFIYEDLVEFVLSINKNERQLVRQTRQAIVEKQLAYKEFIKNRIQEVKQLLLEDKGFTKNLKINERKAYVKEKYNDFYEYFESDSIAQAQRNMIFEEIFEQRSVMAGQGN